MNDHSHYHDRSAAENPSASRFQAIVVMGVSGCGKTTFGKSLAEILSMPFLEGDELHTAANVARMSQGIPLTDEDKLPWLTSIGERLCDAHSNGGIVVSCSALKKSYRDLLRTLAGVPVLFVFLDGKRETLLDRMSRREGHFMPVSLLDSQLATLEDPRHEEYVVAIQIENATESNLSRISEFMAGR